LARLGEATVTLRISGGRRLLSPAGMVARPTAARVRLAVMNLLADRLRGSRWLDLCCGSGAMACEALQRGAAAVVAIERDPRVAALARRNLEAVAAGIARADAPAKPDLAVHGGDALRWLVGGPRARQQERFDLIYLDPPWQADLHGRLTEAVSQGGWLAPGGMLIWECPSTAMPALPAGWRSSPPRRYGGTAVLLLEQDDERSFVADPLA
jgi:16S rRNA (guanine(966)-N(2))-methyltransferase RsmD